MAPGINRLKTWILIAALGGLFVLIGSFWGTNGVIVAFVMAAIMNFVGYFFSDKIALATMRADEVGPDHELYQIVAGLTRPT